jgi:hypothetical protein
MNTWVDSCGRSAYAWSAWSVNRTATSCCTSRDWSRAVADPNDEERQLMWMALATHAAAHKDDADACAELAVVTGCSMRLFTALRDRARNQEALRR